MDAKLRKKLSMPLGPVMKAKEAAEKLKENAPSLLITIGDESTCNILKEGIVPNIAIFDNIIKRKPAGAEITSLIKAKMQKIKKVKNAPATISAGLEDAIKTSIHGKNFWIEVDGEEDLAALPALAHAPAGALILYGQPDEGIVWLEANEKNKRFAIKMIEKLGKP